MPNFDEEKFYSDKFNTIAGIDEVGRGALAGPIVAGAVVFKKYDDIINLLNLIKDSKVLNHKQRKECQKIIKKYALDIGIGIVKVSEIDYFGIGRANILAFDRAIKNMKKCDFALIDGRKFRGFEYPFKALIKGESKSISIAAASIIAKVYRDELMDKIHSEIKHYHFDSNKGYGSKIHIEAIKTFGPSKHHRKTFLKNIISNNIQLL